MELLNGVVSFFEKTGVSLGILIFVGLAIWRILRWTGEKIVIPIKDSHVKLVESAQKTNEVNAETLQKIGQLLEANENRDQATFALVKETHEIVKEKLK